MKKSKIKLKTFLLGAFICSAIMSAYAQSQPGIPPNLKSKEIQSSNPLKKLFDASLDQQGKPTLTPGKQLLPAATNTASTNARQQGPDVAALQKMVEASPQLKAKFYQQLMLQSKQGAKRGMITIAEYENALKQLITNQTK